MKEITVQVSDPKEIQDKMSALGDAWQEVAKKALGEGVECVLYQKVKKLTPRSERTSPWALNKDGTPKKFSNGYKPGMGNLRNNLIIRTVNDSQDERSVSLGAPGVYYSGHVHEMDAEKTHFTHPETSSKYIENPVEELNDKVVEEVCANVDFQLKARGIL